MHLGCFSTHIETKGKKKPNKSHVLRACHCLSNPLHARCVHPVRANSTIVYEMPTYCWPETATVVDGGITAGRELPAVFLAAFR